MAAYYADLCERMRSEARHGHSISPFVFNQAYGTLFRDLENKYATGRHHRMPTQTPPEFLGCFRQSDEVKDLDK